MLPRILVSCAAVLALAGCGTSNQPVASPSLTPVPSGDTSFQTAGPSTPTPKPSSTVSATPTTSPTPSPTSTTRTPAPAPPAAHDTAPRGAVDLKGRSLPQFVNAAMTVTCLFDGSGGTTVRCDVMEPHWGVRKPSSCQDAYGDAVELATRPSLICHGDTIFSPDVTLTLKAGQSAKFGDHWCTVLTAAVRCSNADGHGFTVSQRAYSLD